MAQHLDATAAAFKEIVTIRRAVRQFAASAVDPALIRQALELAARTPSNCNVQPWLIHVVSGAALERLRVALLNQARGGMAPDDDFGSTRTYPGVYRTRQVETAALLYGAIGVERHDADGRRAASLRNFAMFDAPHVALLFVPDWAGPRELADAGAWAQTFMLALTALGVASIPQAALGLYPGTAREVLGIKPGARLLYGVAFGHADADAAVNAFPISRASIEETTTFHE